MTRPLMDPPGNDYIEVPSYWPSFGAHVDFDTGRKWIKRQTKEREATMNKETITAIHKSITHWNDICYGMDNSITTTACALCIKFYKYVGGGSTCFGAYTGTITVSCEGCPVAEKIGQTGCSGTPYKDYAAASKDHNNYCTVASAEAAEAMLETLVGLLPANEIKNKYDVFLSKNIKPGGWLYSGDGDTGITTDGRNRLPQAEEVWRQVFERQDSKRCYINMPIFDSFARGGSFHCELPKPSCPTCGQEVKPKVVKYKVAYEWVGGGGILTSDVYFIDKADFDRNRQSPANEFIGLIKSTAKEFDV